MGRRRARHSRLTSDEIVENRLFKKVKLPKGNRISQKRKRRKEIKTNFKVACENLLVSSVADSSRTVLPVAVPQYVSSSELLQPVSDIVHRYLDVLELHTPPDTLFSADATLTLQTAPHLCCNSLGQVKLKSKDSLHGWTIYERMSVNLLPGSCPLPSWAWQECARSAMKKSKIDKLHKMQRFELKRLQSLQQYHAKRLKSLVAGASSAADRWAPGPLPPPARSSAMGLERICGLLNRLPVLRHVRDDQSCQFDIVDAAPLGIFVRFVCLAVEALSSEDAAVLSVHEHVHILKVTDVGSFFTRLLCHTLLLNVEEQKIINADVCCVPAPVSLVKQCENSIHSIVKSTTAESGIKGMYVRQLDPRSTLSPAVQRDLVQQLMQATNMTEEYCIQCLSECNFDLTCAMETYTRVLQSGLLPSSAFKQNHFP